MKSRISIDVDYDNQPIIRIEYSESEDVRDKLVKKFLETFGGDSSWATFTYNQSTDIHCAPVASNSNAIIRPICIVDMKNHVETIKKSVESHQKAMKSIMKEFS